MAGSIALDSTAQASFSKSIQNLMKDEKLLKASSAPKPKKGVVYITHIPHGFYEEQMKGYFSQFGIVTNVKLARSKKSGKSKGFAFIEFEHAEVAQVVAETMNNYIMCNRLLKAEYIPYERIGGKKFWRTNVTVKSYPRLRNRRVDIFAKNSEKPEEKVGMLLRKRHQRVEGIIEKLNTFGISYSLKDFDAPVEVQPPTPVLEIDESDEEIEFQMRPDFTLKKKILKKSKKSSTKKKKTEVSKNEVANDKCRSPEPKLHLMNVKKNLFGNGENSSFKVGKKSLEVGDVSMTSLASDDTPVRPGKSARKVASGGKNKEPVPRMGGFNDSTLSGKGSSPKSVEPTSKKMAEKFSARLQKKLTRRQQKDAGADKSSIDKFAKKLKRASRSAATKAATDGNRKKFSSKKLTIKGKLQGLVELGL